jgi:predicted transcriptional regulator
MPNKAKYDKLKKLIAINLIKCGYRKEELAKLLGISLSTLYKKLSNPRTFTYSEIQILFYRLKFTQEEILAVV